MIYNTPENKEKYFQCFSLKMMEELIKNDFEVVDEFRHMHTGKLCKVFKIDDRLNEFRTEWSKQKTSI